MRRAALRLASLLAALVLVATGCSLRSGTGQGTIDVTGTAHYSEMEGDFWIIRGDDGTIYDPVGGLPAEFQKEGMRLRLEAKVQPNAVTTHMVGTVVQVIGIHAL